MKRKLQHKKIEKKIKQVKTKITHREPVAEELVTGVLSLSSRGFGFVTPEDQWINGSPEVFRKEMEEAVGALAPLLKKETVMGWYDRIEGRVMRHDFMPWRIICAGHWVKLFDLEV